MKNLSKKELIKMAKDMKLKNYSKLSKTQLIDLISKNYFKKDFNFFFKKYRFLTFFEGVMKS